MYNLEHVMMVHDFAQNTAEDLSSVAVHGQVYFGSPVKIKKLQFVISTVTNGASTVRFSKRVTPGSDTGAVVLGSLTIPSATAVGKVVYKEIEPVSFQAGDVLKLEVTSGATSGAGYYLYEMELDPEVAGNQADMIASA